MSTHRPTLDRNGQLRLHRHHQAGFIQAALLFGIALMTAILGGFALANRSPTSQTDVEQAKVNASVILKQGSDLRDGVQRYATDNGSSAVTSTMDFSAVTSTGLFDVAARYASPQIMPVSAFASAPTTVNPSTSATGGNQAGHWYLNRDIAGNGLGSSAADPMVILPNLRQDVCLRVNRLLYGSTATVPSITTGNLSDFTSLSGGAVTMVAATSGWPEGCVRAQSSEYVYFKTIQEN